MESSGTFYRKRILTEKEEQTEREEHIFCYVWNERRNVIYIGIKNWITNGHKKKKLWESNDIKIVGVSYDINSKTVINVKLIPNVYINLFLNRKNVLDIQK